MTSSLLRDWIESRVGKKGLNDRQQMLLDSMTSADLYDEATGRSRYRQDRQDAIMDRVESLTFRERAAQQARTDRLPTLGEFAGVPEAYQDDPELAKQYLKTIEARKRAAAVTDGDEEGLSPVGMFFGALKGMDTLRRGVFASLAEFGDASSGLNAERYADTDEGSSFLARALAGNAQMGDKLGQTSNSDRVASVEGLQRRMAEHDGWGEGTGDLAAIRMDANDGALTKTAKGLAAFAGDVATDPLSYVGVGVISQTGRKAGSEGAEHAARRLVLRPENGLDVLKLAPDDAAEIATKGLGDEFSARGRVSAIFRDMGEDLYAQDFLTLNDSLDLLRQKAPAAFQDLMVDAVGGVARNGYFARGSTGLRETLGELGKKFGDEALSQDELFAQVPRSIQGGLQVRAPGRGSKMLPVGAQVRKVGGGKLMQSNPLTNVMLNAGHGVRNSLRKHASRLSVLGGKAPIAYRKALEGLSDGSFEADLAQWRGLRDAGQETDRNVANMFTTERAYRSKTMHDAMAQSDVPTEELRQALNISFGFRGNKEEAARRASEAGLSNEAIEFGGKYAEVLHRDIEEIYGQLQEIMGQDRALNWINNYVPRIMADGAREARQKAQGKGWAGWTPFASRSGAYMTVTVDEETGKLVNNYWAPQEANEWAVEHYDWDEAQELFKTDAIQIAGDYLDRLQFVAEQELFYDALRRKGLVQETRPVEDSVREALGPTDRNSSKEWRQKALDRIAEVRQGLSSTDREVVEETQGSVLDRAAIERESRWLDTDVAEKVGKSPAGTTIYERDGLRFWYDRSRKGYAVEPTDVTLAQRAGSRLRDVEVEGADEVQEALSDLTYQELREGPVDPQLVDRVKGAKVKLRADNTVHEISDVRRVNGTAEYRVADQWVRPDEWYDPRTAADVEARDADIMADGYEQDVARVLETLEPSEGVLPRSAIEAGVTVRQGNLKAQRGRLTKWLNSTDTGTELPDVYRARSVSDQWVGAEPFELRGSDGKVLGGFNVRARANGEREVFTPYGVESDLVLDAMLRSGATLAEVPESMVSAFRSKGWVARGPQPLADGRVLMRLDPQLMLGARSGQDVITREAGWETASGALADEAEDVFARKAREAVEGIDYVLDEVPARESRELRVEMAADIAGTLADHARRQGADLDVADGLDWLEEIGLDPFKFARGNVAELRKARQLLEQTLAQPELPDVKAVSDRLGEQIPEQTSKFAETLGEIESALEPTFTIDTTRRRSQLQDKGPVIFDTLEEAEAQVQRLFPDVAAGRAGAEKRRQLDKLAEQMAEDEGLLTQAFDQDTLPPINGGRAEYVQQLVASVGRYVDIDSDQLQRKMFPDHKKVSDYVKDAQQMTGGDWRVAGAQEGIRKSLQERFLETGAMGAGSVLDDIANLHRVLADREDAVGAKMWQPFYNYWKATVTAGSIRAVGFHVRNAYGGMFNAWLKGVSAADFNDAIRIQVALDKAEKATMEELGEAATYAQFVRARNAKLQSTLAGQKGVSKEHAQRLSRAWESFEAMNLDSATRTVDLNSNFSTGGSTTAMGKMARLGRKGQGVDSQTKRDLLDLAGAGTLTGQKRRDQSWRARAAQARLENRVSQKMGADSAQAIERYLRLGTFLRGAKDWGLDDNGVAASMIVRATQFDYADLSPTELKLRSSMVGLPFYTWVRNNLPLQARMFVSDPGRMNAVARGIETAQDITGSDPEDRAGEGGDDGSILPQWVEESMGWDIDLGGYLSEIGMGDMAQGQMTFRPDIPLMDLNRWLEVPREGERNNLLKYVDEAEAINSWSPAAKAVVEGITGTSTFTKGRLVESEAPYWAKALDTVWGDAVRTQDGEELVNAQLNNAVRQLAPDIATLDRFIGATDRDKERQASSLLSGFAGLPVATSSPRQVNAELRSEMYEMEDVFNDNAGDWQSAVKEQVDVLLEQGAEPGQIRQEMERRGLLAPRP